jgi:hypothetical protein
MASLNTIKNWFKSGLKPTQAQFWETWDSFWHKDDRIPVVQIDGVDALLDQKANKSVVDNHLVDSQAHAAIFSLKEDVSKKGQANGYVPLDEFKKIASDYLNIVNNLTTNSGTSLLSASMGKALQGQIDNINSLLQTNGVNLEYVQQLIASIAEVQTSLATILVNNLTAGGVNKALTAEMGKELANSKVDKVTGKGLSSQDFTLEFKQKIEALVIANASANGLISALDWAKFNAKQDAIGFTPYNASNPAGYISAISQAMVLAALGFTPYSSNNPSGYISGISKAMVLAALGFTPYDSANPSGYISGISQAMVIAALGFTPYNSSNPAGYVTASGSVNYSNSAGSVSWSNVTGKPAYLSNFVNDLGNYGGWLTGINKAMVLAALDYTPYNSSNPAGYITGASLGNYLPLSGGTMSGNLTINGGNIAISGEIYAGQYFKAGAGANEPYLWNPYGGDHWRATASAWFTYIGVGSTNFFSTSLRSSKTNITPFIRSALDIIIGVNVVEFNYKTDLENKRIGFIADDTVQELSTKNHNQMDINSTIGVLIKGVQEQQEMIVALKAEIEILKQKQAG